MSAVRAVDPHGQIPDPTPVHDWSRIAAPSDGQAGGRRRPHRRPRCERRSRDEPAWCHTCGRRGEGRSGRRIARSRSAWVAPGRWSPASPPRRARGRRVDCRRKPSCDEWAGPATLWCASPIGRWRRWQRRGLDPAHGRHEARGVRRSPPTTLDGPAGKARMPSDGSGGAWWRAGSRGRRAAGRLQVSHGPALDTASGRWRSERQGACCALRWSGNLLECPSAGDGRRQQTEPEQRARYSWAHRRGPPNMEEFSTLSRNAHQPV